MKKLAFLLFASALVLGACSNEGTEQKSDKVNESKVQYKDNTVVLDQAVLYIKDVFILNNQNSGKKEIVFKYEAKNKTDKDEITPSNVFRVATQVKQDNGSTVDKLNTGMSLMLNGKYKEWLEHSHDTIKKDKTAKGMSAYQLKNDNKVIVKFTQGVGGKDLGEKVYDLSKLKTVDYSPSDDANNAANSDDENNQNEKADNENTDVANANASTHAEEKVSQVVNNHNDNTATTNSKIRNSNKQSNEMTPEQINEWNQNKPTTHDKSQTEDPYTPSYAQYQANKAFSDDMRNNPSKYDGGGIGGGPGIFVYENETYNQYKDRVVNEYKRLQP